MQFNELLEQYSIKEISQRTRVAPENIEHLQGGDWEMMRKVQALGFISIIEREFGVDLSELRKECLDYYREHQQGLGGERYELHTDSKTLYANLLPKILIALFVIVALVGSWYAFVQKNTDFNNKISQKRSNQGFYDSVINVAKDIVKDTNSSNTTQISIASELTPPNAPKENEKSITLNDNKSISKKSNIEETKKLKLEYAKKPEENNSEKEKDSKISKEDKKEEKTLKISDIIPATTINISKSKETIIEQTKKEPKESDKVVEDKIDTNIEVVSLLPEVPSLSKSKDDKQAKTTENTQEKKATNSAAVVILTPRSKVWIGFRELRSGKRTAEVVQKDQAITFDTTKSDYILATGHGVLTFKNGNDKELLKLHDGKKHFFMIAKGGVREISHEKFQKLNGSKVW